MFHPVNVLYSFFAISLLSACLSMQTATVEASAVSIGKAGRWATYPLFGGETTSIAADPKYPQVIYIGTRDAGVFKTTNGGMSWKPARKGLSFYPIRTLRVNPQNSQIVYAGTDYDGLWKSTDGGATWIKTSNGLDKDLIVFNIEIDPTNSNIIYLGLAGGFGLGIGNVYKSINGGSTWVRKLNGLPLESDAYTNGIFSLVIDQDHPAILYVGTTYEGAFRSRNGGESWSAINNCFPIRNSDGYKPLNALAVNPHDNNRPGAIIEGRYYILDDQECWKQISGSQDYLGGVGPTHLYFHPIDPRTIFVAGGEFNVSNDGGVSWDQRLGHPDSGEIPAIAFHPSFPNTLFAAEDVLFDYPGGVYRSADQGMTWEKRSDGITATAVRSVALDPRDPAYLYVGTGGSHGHLFGSQDGGLTWAQLHYNALGLSGLDFGFSVNDIAVGPSSQHIYVAGKDLFRSTDHGKSFDAIAEDVSSPETIAIAPGAPENIYVGTYSQGIYKSSTAGTTWVKKSQGLPDGSRIVSLTIDPNRPQTVWAGTWFWQDGIFRSNDGGETWILKGMTGHYAIRAIAVKPGNSNEILIGREGPSESAVFKSINGGETWQVKASNIGAPYKIAYHPQDPSIVYAATEGTGVIRSLDGGETWQEFNDGIFFPLVYDFELYDDATPLLVAGTYGAGLVGREIGPNESNGICSECLPSWSGWRASLPEGIVTSLRP